MLLKVLNNNGVGAKAVPFECYESNFAKKYTSAQN
jgi:hypothetical protein